MPYAQTGCGLFITGTDTGVGKTYVAALIARARGRRGVAWAFTSRRPAVALATATPGFRRRRGPVAGGRPAGQAGGRLPAAFRRPAGAAPGRRGRRQATRCRLLRSGLDFWRERSDFVLVEGAGGLMSPLGDDEYVADLAYDFGFPLVVVARNRLGTINQVLQTLIVAATFRDGLNVAGVVLNETSPRARTQTGAQCQRDSPSGCAAAVGRDRLPGRRLRSAGGLVQPCCTGTVRQPIGCPYRLRRSFATEVTENTESFF